MMLLPSKPAIQSLGVWGGAIAVIPQIYVLLDNALSIPLGTTQQLTTAVVSVVGGALAIWGRWKARHAISGVISSSPTNPLGQK